MKEIICPFCEGTGNSLKVIDDSEIIKKDFRCRICKGKGKIQAFS